MMHQRCRAMATVLLLVMIASFVHAQSPSPKPVCIRSAYEDIWKYEIDDNGLLVKMNQCQQAILSLTQIQFGPPSAFEVMNILCKGTCRAYMSRYHRISHAADVTGCNCADLKPRCPKSPLDMLCLITGFCYDTDLYWEGVCEPSSCGRFVLNEKDYKGARNRCKLSLESGVSSSKKGGFATSVVLGAVLIASVIGNALMLRL